MLEEATLHPAWLYLLRDLGGSLWAGAVFALALLVPGYAVARWMLPDFCSTGLREQLAWSVAASFGVGTIVLVGLAWITGVAATGYGLIAIAVGVGFSVCKKPPRRDVPRRELLRWSALAFGWTLFILFSLVDVGLHNHLWMSVVTFDHSVRSAFVGAVMRSGVPPANPLYWPGHAAPMRYYYFWYVLCGVVARLAHVSARQALIASCLWPIAGIAAMLALFARHMLGWTGHPLRRRWGFALALLAVTGLDLLAYLGAHFAGDPFYGDMEWWSIDQVSSWADTFLWVPHHAAALVCGLLCALLLWRCQQEPVPRTRCKMACVAGACFASSFGLSTYVALGTLLMLAPWAFWQGLRHRSMRLAQSAGLASCAALLLLSPFLWQLLHPSGPQGTSAGHVLGFGVRRMLDPSLLNNIAGFRGLRAAHPGVETNLAALALLLPGYIAELGVFGLVLCLASRPHPSRSSAERTVLWWTWSALAAVTFIRSQLLATDDFGYRAALLVQFFLLLLTVVVWTRSSTTARRWLIGLAIVGVLGTACQVLILRLFLPWRELRSDPAVAGLAECNYALRDAYSALDNLLPPTARLQDDPSSNTYILSAQMLQANRQMVNADPGCSTNFGGELSACAPLQLAIAALFRSPAPSAADAIALCNSIHADDLLVTRWDAAWYDARSWTQALPRVLDRPSVRVLRCPAPEAIHAP
jgi:hypothetical protein